MDIDWGTLHWALTQPNLSIEVHFGQEAAGDESLDQAPVQAYFYWKDAHGTSRWSHPFLKAELAECIATLEQEQVSVPSEFRQALDDFPQG
jgi:hypothetical protein